MESTVLLTLSSRRFFSPFGVLELANNARDEYVLATHKPEVLASVTLLGLRIFALRVFGLGEVFSRFLLVLDEFVGASDRCFYASSEDLFR